MEEISRESRLCRHLGLVLTGVILIAVWSLSHSYQGIYHDGRLYALQALARIHPESLANDVFLKFGSQDRFSIFSPIYAATARLAGLENAASLLTLLFQLSFIGCASALARTLATPALALLGICVLIAIPGTYGADRTFICIETYLTPRMAAEALTLAALAAAMTSRQWLATACIAVSALLHPIMAAAGIACLFFIYASTARFRWSIATSAVAAVVGGGGALAYFEFGAGRFDAPWLSLIESRSPFLFVTKWRMDDWAPLVVALATLALAVMAPANPKSKKLASAVLASVISGFAFTLIGCDWLHLILPTQVQAWRWQWLGTVVAALLLPLVLLSLWRREVSGRISALLLITAWVFASDSCAILPALAAPTALVFVRKLGRRHSRLLLWGSCTLLAIASAWRIGSNLQFTNAHYVDLHTSLWLRRVMSFASDGSIPLAFIGLTWYAARHRRFSPTLGLIALAAIGICTASIQQAWSAWSASEYSPRTIAAFAPMRNKIPAGAEVFWPDSPVSSWALLNAPNYLSVVQTSGMIFSRASALELERRAKALDATLPPDVFMNWNTAAPRLYLSKAQLTQVCATAEFDFLVTSVDLGTEAVAVVTIGEPARSLHLYRCTTPKLERSQALAAAAST